MIEPVPVYDSAQQAPAVFEELVQAARYGDLIKQLIRRDIVSRYKRSVLGVAWTMLNPLGTMLVLILAFSAIFGSTRAYAVYVLSGLIVWNFFSQGTSSAIQQLAWGSALLHRIYIPRATFAISATGTGLVNLLLSLVPLALVMIVTRTHVTRAIVLLPLSLALLALFVLGVGLLMSTFAVYFADVVEMYQIALLGWMYLTPIIYPEGIVPPSYRWWMFNINPMYHLVYLFRASLGINDWPHPQRVITTAAMACGVFVAGWILFTSKADEFAYRA